MSVFHPSVNEVVAKNIRRERNARGWSRSRLAAEASHFSTKPWVEWRVIDLEGGRSGSGPASARWEEIVSLSNALRVPIWDLVLPGAGSQVALVDRRPSEDGSLDSVVLEAGEFAEVLSGFDGDKMIDPSLRNELRIPSGGTIRGEDLAAALRSLAAQVDDQSTSGGAQPT